MQFFLTKEEFFLERKLFLKKENIESVYKKSEIEVGPSHAQKKDGQTSYLHVLKVQKVLSPLGHGPQLRDDCQQLVVLVLERKKHRKN